MKEKMCTKCGEEYEIEKFEKGPKGKYTSRCKKCAARYGKERKERKDKEIEASLKEKIKPTTKPIFEDVEKPNQEKVKRVQKVLLAGDVDKFIKITCPCGLPMNLEYQYSYDSKNDYYEEVCPVCGKIFKQTVTSK